MVHSFEKNITKNKLVFLSISVIYGLNTHTAFSICQCLGFSQNLKIKQLTLKQINKINMKLGRLNQKLSNDLKNFKLHRKKKLLITKSYKALRLFKKLPIRGQWTHTNAKTAKNFKLNVRIVIFLPIIWFGDCSVMYQLGFQDPATTTMEGVFLFNIHLLFVIISIVLFVAWLLFITLKNFTELTNSKVLNFTHSNYIEIVWTSIPAFILLSLASPSFSLLFSLDEIANSELTLKILGCQWFWAYEISDFNSCANSNTLKYSSYMLTNESLNQNNFIGFFWNLETNKRVILPTNTHLRLLVSAVDVLHSWAIPSFGVKVDACPGRLNQANLFIKRFGVFFGQCSEICGVNHAFMPIVLLAVPSINYHYLIMANLNFN